MSDEEFEFMAKKQAYKEYIPNWVDRDVGVELFIAGAIWARNIFTAELTTEKKDE